MDQRVQKILQRMREGLDEDLSLDEFAQSVNLSVWRLCHIFRSDIGIPPIHYLRSLRMERAKHLLETTFLSIKEITHNVGLNDESHFVRDFKKVYGEPPTLYRRHFSGEQLETSHGVHSETKSANE
jgi:transcriptional regulator GlxA family with amidase domain